MWMKILNVVMKICVFVIQIVKEMIEIFEYSNTQTPTPTTPQ